LVASTDPDGTYEVLDTDYENWTAVYSCFSIGPFNFENAWLMSRSSTLSPEVLGAVQAVFTRNGVDVNKFDSTVHSDSCNYAP
jgi:apolipoprotein D and lipocalin family protein